MPGPEPLRYEHFNRLAEQFPAWIAEQLLSLGIHQDNRPGADDSQPSNETASRWGEGSAPSFVVFPDLDLLSRPLWQAVCAEARRLVTSPGDRALLAGSQLLGREQNQLVIGMNGRSAAQRAELRLGPPLSQVARTLLRRPVELRFVSLDDA